MTCIKECRKDGFTQVEACVANLHFEIKKERLDDVPYRVLVDWVCEDLDARQIPHNTMIDFQFIEFLEKKLEEIN